MANREHRVCRRKEFVKNHIGSIWYTVRHLLPVPTRTAALGRAQAPQESLLRQRDSTTSSGGNRICLSATRRTCKAAITDHNRERMPRKLLASPARKRNARIVPFFICEQLLQPDRSRYRTYRLKKERGERLLKDALPFSPISTGHSPRPMYYFNPMQTSNPVPRISLPITGEAVAICVVRAAPAIAPFRYFGISLKAGREGAEPPGQKINNGQESE